MTFNTPILFIIYNRPVKTQLVFNTIKLLKPKYLYVAADGYNNFDANENKLKCEQTRCIIDNQIDWDCIVTKNYQLTNLGCGIGVSSAITWFFDNVDYGIILEDDCLPNTDFFSFCEMMLLKYKENDRIFSITGNNFLPIEKENDSYFISKYNHVWGWATWKRAWDMYDYNISFWLKWRNSINWHRMFNDDFEKKYFYRIFNDIYFNLKKHNTWDYQWMATVWFNNGLTIAPNVNLVSNIGFGTDATHTTESSSLDSLEVLEMGKIIHPKLLTVNRKKDFYNFYYSFEIKKTFFPLEYYFKLFISKFGLLRYFLKRIIFLIPFLKRHFS
jgi:hypothetical protein